MKRRKARQICKGFELHIEALSEITLNRPHKGRPRQVQHGQLIHESVLKNIERTKNTPKALLYGSLDWSDTEELKSKQLVERDIYLNASTLMDELGKKNDVSDADVNTILTLFASGKWMVIGIVVRNSD
jgi:hypothetical protein